MDEASAYLAHDLLGPRYRECVEALQQLGSSDPIAVFGNIDALKLRSSLTLFEAAQPCPLFAGALDRWFGGERDLVTLRMLAGCSPEDRRRKKRDSSRLTNLPAKRNIKGTIESVCSHGLPRFHP